MRTLSGILFFIFTQGIICLDPASPTLETASISTKASRFSSSDTVSIVNYNFDAPIVSFELQKRLKEISGLTVIDENTVAAIQDEDGKVFFIDLQDGKVEDDFRFEEKGDFEGIERVGKDLYVLRSDGTLFEIESFQSKDRSTSRIKTSLKSKHDTEGLAYDKRLNRLLVLCKEFPGDNLKGKRAIYAFDLETKLLLDDPVFIIDMDEVTSFAVKEENAYLRFSKKLLSEGFDSGGFKPSALAIHPENDLIYIISSVEKLILALNNSGEIEAVWPLSDKLFRQPEGLAFLPGGDLLISNEADGKDATLLRFESE